MKTKKQLIKELKDTLDKIETINNMIHFQYEKEFPKMSIKDLKYFLGEWEAELYNLQDELREVKKSIKEHNEKKN